MKTPTNKQKIAMYESFLHLINLAFISGNNELIKELLDNADRWSYAHRVGEHLSDKERRQLINAKFWKLCDTNSNKKE